MSGRPLILAYHACAAGWASPLAISPDRLDEQAAFLRRRGYVGLTAGDAEARRATGTLPERCVAFTFDDGYASTLAAAEVLERHGYIGTVFVVTDAVGQDQPMRWFGVEDEDPAQMRPLDWEGLAQLRSQGWEIGSHTCTHRLVTSLSRQDLADELTRSRHTLSERLGACDTLAYPYGIADGRAARAAEQAGYRAAFTLTMVDVADEPHRRNRLGLTNSDRGLRLAATLSAPARWARRSTLARRARRLRRSRPWIPTQVDISCE